MQQLVIPRIIGRGGARPGAGRPRNTGRDRRVPHARRPDHPKSYPAHVTMRRARLLPGMRSQRIVIAFERSLERARSAKRTAWKFRVVHYSVQHDHIHLVVEARDRVALSRGMQGLSVRLARDFNRVTKRRGKVWGDRYFARDLCSPREVRNGIVYVLMNHKKHGARSPGIPESVVDVYSSAFWFEGWSPAADWFVIRLRGYLPTRVVPVSEPRTWLADRGWRRHGRVQPDERPG